MLFSSFTNHTLIKLFAIAARVHDDRICERHSQRLYIVSFAGLRFAISVNVGIMTKIDVVSVKNVERTKIATGLWFFFRVCFQE